MGISGRRINSALLGAAVGFGAACFFLPGGYDARQFYLHAPVADTTAPAWVYLLTYPLGLLPWPWGWGILTMGSIYLAGRAAEFRNVGMYSKWWIVVFSAPMVWNVWLGQIEVFPIIGLLLSELVWRRRIHPLWLGAAWLGLLTKPQVGAGLLLVIGYWIWREQGWRAILWAAASSCGIALLTLALWPGWPLRWLIALRDLNPSWWNAAIWPYGLLALPLAFLSTAQPIRRLRLVGAATLLASPYFALYHCAALLTLADSAWALALSWLPVVLGMTFFGEWMKLGWLLPFSILVMDLVAIIGERRRRDA